MIQFFTRGDMVYVLQDKMIFEMDFATGTFACMPERFCKINWQLHTREIKYSTFKVYVRRFADLNPCILNYKIKV